MPVRKIVGFNLGASRKRVDLDRALVLADELIRLDPKRLDYIGLEQYIYGTRWLAFKHRSEDA